MLWTINTWMDHVVLQYIILALGARTLPAHFGLKGVFLWTEDEKTQNKVMKETQRL